MKIENVKDFETAMQFAKIIHLNTNPRLFERGMTDLILKISQIAMEDKIKEVNPKHN